MFLLILGEPLPKRRRNCHCVLVIGSKDRLVHVQGLLEMRNRKIVGFGTILLPINRGTLDVCFGLFGLRCRRAICLDLLEKVRIGKKGATAISNLEFQRTNSAQGSDKMLMSS